MEATLDGIVTGIHTFNDLVNDIKFLLRAIISESHDIWIKYSKEKVDKDKGLIDSPGIIL